MTNPQTGRSPVVGETIERSSASVRQSPLDLLEGLTCLYGAATVGSIPTSASNSKYRLDKELQISKPSSASKSASRFVTRKYSTTTPRSPRHDLLKRNWPCVWCH